MTEESPKSVPFLEFIAELSREVENFPQWKRDAFESLVVHKDTPVRELNRLREEARPEEIQGE